MKKFHRNLLDGMMGRKDEREQLEAYERLALGAAYIFWIAILLNLVGMLADWAPAKWSGSVLLLIFLLVHGWPKGKARDLSDDAIPNPREITPETALSILKQARWRSLAWGDGDFRADCAVSQKQSTGSPQRRDCLFRRAGVFGSGRCHVRQRGEKSERNFARIARRRREGLMC